MNIKKKQKSNIDIEVQIKFNLNIEQAIDSMKFYSEKLNFNVNNSKIQSGFYYSTSDGKRIYQIWTIPYSSLTELIDKEIKTLDLDYSQFRTGKELFRQEENGNLSFIDLNTIDNSVKLTPETIIAPVSSIGEFDLNLIVQKKIKARKIKDFNKP